MTYPYILKSLPDSERGLFQAEAFLSFGKIDLAKQ